MNATRTGAMPLARGTQRGFVLFTMCLGVLIAQVDTSVVNLALAPIGASLHAEVGALQWVVDAYNLVYASLLLTAGTLGDFYGRRRIFGFGVGIFTAGSLLCGLAPDQTVLIAGRAVTGLGAALLVPTSLAILAVTYSDAHERAHAIGIWASCYGVALALGASLGGLLVAVAGWRSVFIMTVTIGALALAMMLKVLPETRDAAGRRLDLMGQTLAILTLALLTLAAIDGPRWDALPVAVCLGAAVLAAAVFLVVEARTEGALVPLAILRRPGLLATMPVASLMTFGMYAMLFLTPLYLQQQHGASVVAAAFELLPPSVR